MATIKVEQSSINELRAAITFAAEQTSQAANMVSKAIDGMSGMSFLAKPRLESELVSLKNRLNQQARLSQSYSRAVQETVDALAQVDGSAGTSSEGVWSKTSAIVGAAMGGAIAAGGLSLAAQDQMGKQSGPNITFINGTPGLGSSSSPNITFANTTSSPGSPSGPNVTFSAQTSSNGPNVSWNAQGGGAVGGQVTDHTIPFISAYIGDRDASIWPDGYNGGAGCAVASTSSALSGLLGQNITPKQIMSYQGNNELMYWNNCGSALGVTASLDQTGQTSSIDVALNRYLNDPSRYSAPIIGSSNPQHYVVVTGKNADGSYSIIDSSGYNARTYTYSPSTPQLNGNGFKGNLVQVVQYQKKS